MKRLGITQRPYFAHRVLEIGGGHDPYSGVTHAVDKFPDDNTQRAASLNLGKNVEFRAGDLESIPYDSKPRFDFIYVSHVIEHVSRPEAAISEINRVAGRGYLETPSPLREQLACPLPFVFGQDFHLLFCWMEAIDRSVHVIEKDSARIGEFCDCPNGRIARKLFRAVREKGIDVEPLLPRSAKTSQLRFDGTVTLVRQSDFISACRAGHCAYRSASQALRWASVPHRWIGRRFATLDRLLKSP